MNLTIPALGVFLCCAAAVGGQAWPETQPDELGPNYKVWHLGPRGGASQFQPPVEREDASPRAGGVVQLDTGMNYWDGQQWVPSDPSFDLTTNAFVATRVQHKVRLSAQLNRIGAVTVNTRDGQTLNSTPVGVALFDPVSGRFEVIASITNSIGVLVSSNQVLYPDAFGGGVCADVVYTLKKGSFEQDVILTGQFDPTDFGFPTNSRLQVLTEFYQAPLPDRVRHPLYIERNEVLRKQMASPDVMDETLGFGEFVLGPGRAYVAPTTAYTNGLKTAVGKEFKTLSGRTFLIETLDCLSIRAGLKELPRCVNGKTTAGNLQKPDAIGNGYANIPSACRTQTDTRPRRTQNADLAKAVESRSGVVIDYYATIGGTLNDPVVFRGDTTYHITGAVYCNGQVTIEGGAVIKYNDYGSITLNNTCLCLTSGYRPAFLTSVNDDTVGDSLSGYSGYTGVLGTVSSGTDVSGSGAYPYLWAATGSIGLSNMRFRYAEEAVLIEGESQYSTIAHSQFLNCVRGVVLVGSYGGSGSSGSGASQNVHFYNILMDQVGTVLVTVNLTGAGSGNSAPAWFQSCTMDHITSFFACDSTFDNYFQNCILANVSNLGSGSQQGGNNAFYNAQTFGNSPLTLDSSPFASPVGGGYHYLATSASCRNKGWESDPELTQRTTAPPLPYGSPIISAATWAMEAQRDTDALDAGYHYDALDYMVSNVTLSASLNLSEGVAVGVMAGSGAGFNLQAGAGISSTGAAKKLNRICYYGNVQEYSVAADSCAFMRASGALSATLRFRFTDFGMRPGNPSTDLLSNATNISGEFSFRDCQLRGCMLSLNPTTSGSSLNVALNNNFVEYTTLSFVKVGTVPMAVDLYNNLFRNSSVSLNYSTSANPTWHAQDNLFDGTGQTVSGSTAYLVASYNGYISGTSNSLGGSNNKTGLNSDYQTGPLGTFYYPSSGSSPSLATLINAGSRNAGDAGLYHYTVKTSANSKEGADSPATVDIGYHYVGLDGDIFSANPQPLDTDGDGIPDYLEDVNGDGSATGDPTSWQVYNSGNGLAAGSGLLVFTPLK